MMSEKPLKMARSTSSQKIRKAMKNFQRMSKEQRIDLMVEAKVITPEQAERAKRKWAEIQSAK
jgi:alkanesulfonate monooxygenase SsuD/methylene tetrahydromethanopterin reductase-like flavin-dependent oxidoreductase (luciferase family)